MTARTSVPEVQRGMAGPAIPAHLAFAILFGIAILATALGAVTGLLIG
jgi:hypothetical protein